MSNLAESSIEVDHLTSSALHVLSTMIVSDGQDAVVVGAVSVAERLATDLAYIIRYGKDIAAGTNRKFKYGPQSAIYNWHVIFSGELRCFIAVRRTHRNIMR